PRGPWLRRIGDCRWRAWSVVVRSEGGIIRPSVFRFFGLRDRRRRRLALQGLDQDLRVSAAFGVSLESGFGKDGGGRFLEVHHRVEEAVALGGEGEDLGRAFLLGAETGVFDELTSDAAILIDRQDVERTDLGQLRLVRVKGEG